MSSKTDGTLGVWPGGEVGKTCWELVLPEVCKTSMHGQEYIKYNMARWRSGNAVVCKTSMHGFDSRPGIKT